MLFAGDVVVDGGVGRRWVLGVGCRLFFPRMRACEEMLSYTELQNVGAFVT